MFHYRNSPYYLFILELKQTIQYFFNKVKLFSLSWFKRCPVVGIVKFTANLKEMTYYFITMFKITYSIIYIFM